MTPEQIAEKHGLKLASEIYQKIYDLFLNGQTTKSNELFNELPEYGQTECYNCIVNAYGRALAEQICR